MLIARSVLVQGNGTGNGGRIEPGVRQRAVCDRQATNELNGSRSASPAGQSDVRFADPVRKPRAYDPPQPASQAPTRPGTLAALPEQAWRRARDADGLPRDGAHVAKLTRWTPATFTGWRITVFATNTRGGRLAGLEVRHRLRARAEDRIRGLKDTGLRNLPLQEFSKNQIWLELVSSDLRTARLAQLLARPDHLPEPGNPNACDYEYWPSPDASSPPPAAHPAPVPAMALDRPHHQRRPPPRSTDLNSSSPTTNRNQEESATQRRGTTHAQTN
jgi:hypothetical protein